MLDIRHCGMMSPAAEMLAMVFSIINQVFELNKQFSARCDKQLSARCS